MEPIERIRVVGAGAMGRGIAQIAATAGYLVELTDADDDAVPAALEFVATMIQRSVDKGKRDADEAAAILARLTAGSAPTAPSSDIDLVIEAVVEKLPVKQAIFAELETATPNAVLASNTSSLSITAIASALRDPARLIGLHFFNPVPLMSLVEIVPGLRTAPELVDTATAFVARSGHTPILARDTPGFLVNHIGRALPSEALAILSEQIASPADIDRIVRETLGLRMGPFELMDLTGLDVSHPVMETVSAGFYGDPRLRPSPIAAARVAAGLLGRKTGEGFYRYRDGAPLLPAEPDITPDAEATPVHVHNHPDFAAALRRAGATVLESPSAEAISLVLPIGEPTYRLAARYGLDPARTLGIDPLGLDRGRLTVVVPAAADPLATAPALRVLAAAGYTPTPTADGTAPVAQRILGAIVNLSCALAEHGIGTPEDIDRGARLGLGYPLGPLELGESVGAERITAILDGLYAYTRDPRYRVSSWLRTRAEQRIPLHAKGTRPEDLLTNRGTDVRSR
ncbi:3-hydroxyacyl-CoA dehydrogenase [Nocardia bhagyanarayanae]|uniref:3-hydroxybutyryl-CoA dehydrogenase n=1 Tax=Nocardia bhagyanarayanae TaxID=1215925 RepID=A0A543EY31_9NOCA|nr:3-hydroxyacyl-CoA dehydrogenase [Nocardia bhagyanarayanae]TQM26481.1 3-hydroxybutyryl-CoA dehydrogenase [Nocardia bhagyanarayanae]